MKILFCFYPLNNPGGILNNQEGLYAAYKEMGHEVDVRLLVWKEEIRVAKSRRRLTPETGAMGLAYDQELGWYWSAEKRFPYKGKGNLKRWKDFASRFDLIIWQIPVPTMQKENRGNTDWLELYNVTTKQIAYIHDGNMEDSYPWIGLIANQLTGVVGVHPCAYHGLNALKLPRAMAFSPQRDIEKRIMAAEGRGIIRNGWLSLQTFKAWKRVDELVRAVPYMNNYPRLLAGGGLHMYYMTSKDKMKEEYIASRDHDPDLPKSSVGKPIWKLAESAGMRYLGYLTNAQREENMREVRFLIDPSWSLKYASIGDHFNRTSVDGIIGGAVPIARNLGVATNVAGVGEFFKPGKHYVMVPYDATPKEFAEIVNDAMAMSESNRRDMINAGTDLLPLFDYQFSAQTFLDLAAGKPAGVYKKPNDIGHGTVDLSKAARKAMDTFFNDRQGAEK